MPSISRETIISNTEAGSIKSFPFNLGIQDEEFHMNSIRQFRLGPYALPLIALEAPMQPLEGQAKHYSESK